MELSRTSTGAAIPAWTLVTSHGLVLLYVSSNPEATIREISEKLSLTDRRVCDIIRDLASEELLRVQRVGRKNHYSLMPTAKFRHPIMSGLPFESFVTLWRRSRSNN